MLQNLVDYKAKSFLSEQNTSTIAYEVKAVRALWDPSLSIPGTNRRGGWRCPIGTRYGGQITDRFGRSCGWGVARRIANQISDIGQRLENVDDARRGSRIARRERRILGRLNPEGGGAGRLEQGLRGVAERLDGGSAPSPRGARRRTVVARPPSVDAPDTPRELTPAPRAPRAPRRRRAPNLRESEQRRMEREIEQPGAPRTGEAPARRRRRAVVEASKTPKAPTQQEAKPRPQVEPKIVKPRRPKPKVDVREPDPALERLLDEEEEVSRRVRRGENVDIGNPPKGFKEVGNGRWRKGDWYIAVDQNEDQVLGLTASNGQGRIVQARNFNELVERMNTADRRPQPGNSDNAANSERLRQARADRARGAGRKVDLNQLLNDEDFEGYVLNDVIPNDRIMIVNDPANFPSFADEQKIKRNEARQRIVAANARLERIEQAITRGELADNDFIERNGEKINIARVKTFVKDYRDAWQEVYDTNLPDEPPKAPPAARRIPSAPPAIAKPLTADPFATADKPKRPEGPVPDKIAYKPEKIKPAFDAKDQEFLDKYLLGIKDAAELQRAISAMESIKFINDSAQMEAVRAHQKLLLKALKQVNDGVSVETALANAKQINQLNHGDPARENQRLTEAQLAYGALWTQIKELPPGRNISPYLDRAIALRERVSGIEKRIALRTKFEQDLKNAIERKRLGFVLDENNSNLNAITPTEVKAKIAVDIEKAVEKRGKKLDEYLKEKYPTTAVRPQFEDMDPTKWRTLSASQKKNYLTEAYSHKLIKGKNGKFYSAKVTSITGTNDYTLSVQFDEVDKDGNLIRSNIASSRRQVTPSQRSVYNSSFFITLDKDKGADLATIYNQQAFAYLKKIGITKAGVTPADDGRYVWARLGFKDGSSLQPQQIESLEGALEFYRTFGTGGLIASDDQYFAMKKLVDFSKGGGKVSKQELIFLIDRGDIDERARRDYIKHWFTGNVPLYAANLDFAEQKVGEFVSPRNKRKKATKKI